MSQDQAANDIAGLLHKIGPMTRKELVDLVPGSNQHTIAKMERTGYISFDKHDKELVRITNAGLRRIGIVDPAVATSRDKCEIKPYTGTELHAFSGRAGASDALKIPSRRFDGLHYRSEANHESKDEENA